MGDKRNLEKALSRPLYILEGEAREDDPAVSHR